MPPFFDILPPPPAIEKPKPREIAPPHGPYESLTLPPALFAAGDVMGKMWGTDSWAVSGGAGPTPPGDYTFRTGLTEAGRIVDLVPATQAALGGMLDAPNNATQYARQGGAWTPLTAGPPLNYRVGIDLNGTDVDLLPANTNGEIGGVTVVARSTTQGLAITGAGALTLPVATDALLGGVRVPAHDLVNGAMLLNGVLTVPLATKEQAGSVVDPPADGRLYARRGSVIPNGAGEWFPAALASIFTHLQQFNLTGAETPNSVVGTYTIPAASLPTVPFLWTIAGTGDGAAFIHNFAGPVNLTAGSLQLQLLDGATWEAVTAWSFATAVFPAGGPSVARGTVQPIGANRIRQYSGAGGIQFRLFVASTVPSGPATIGVGIEGQILQFT
jgi:hypothetical protein